MHTWAAIGGGVAMVGAGLWYAFAPAAPLAPAPVPETSETVSVLFVGDMMFDRYIRTRAEANGYAAIFADAADLMRSHDAVIGNLEGPVAKQASVSRGTKVGDPANMRFVFDPIVPGVLREFNVQAVSIGNNHIRDFGNDGLSSTRVLLSEAGIMFVGDPDDPASPAVFPVKGVKIGLLAYNEFVGQDAEELVSAVKELDGNADIVAVLAHFGVEYETEPTERQRILAHRLVDSGADLIIGTHSHVRGQTELYRGVPIYYSLGNFVFDQYFSPEVRRGLAVSVTLPTKAPFDISVAEIETELRPDGTTGLVP